MVRRGGREGVRGALKGKVDVDESGDGLHMGGGLGVGCKVALAGLVLGVPFENVKLGWPEANDQHRSRGCELRLRDDALEAPLSAAVAIALAAVTAAPAVTAVVDAGWLGQDW